MSDDKYSNLIEQAISDFDSIFYALGTKGVKSTIEGTITPKPLAKSETDNSADYYSVGAGISTAAYASLIMNQLIGTNLEVENGPHYATWSSEFNLDLRNKTTFSYNTTNNYFYISSLGYDKATLVTSGTTTSISFAASNVNIGFNTVGIGGLKATTNGETNGYINLIYNKDNSYSEYVFAIPTSGISYFIKSFTLPEAKINQNFALTANYSYSSPAINTNDTKIKTDPNFDYSNYFSIAITETENDTTHIYVPATFAIDFSIEATAGTTNNFLTSSGIFSNLSYAPNSSTSGTTKANVSSDYFIKVQKAAVTDLTVTGNINSAIFQQLNGESWKTTDQGTTVEIDTKDLESADIFVPFSNLSDSTPYYRCDFLPNDLGINTNGATITPGFIGTDNNLNITVGTTANIRNTVYLEANNLSSVSDFLNGRLIYSENEFSLNDASSAYIRTLIFDSNANDDTKKTLNVGTGYRSSATILLGGEHVVELPRLSLYVQPTTAIATTKTEGTGVNATTTNGDPNSILKTAVATGKTDSDYFLLSLFANTTGAFHYQSNSEATTAASGYLNLTTGTNNDLKFSDSALTQNYYILKGATNTGTVSITTSYNNITDETINDSSYSYPTPEYVPDGQTLESKISSFMANFFQTTKPTTEDYIEVNLTGTVNLDEGYYRSDNNSISITASNPLYIPRASFVYIEDEDNNTDSYIQVSSPGFVDAGIISYFAFINKSQNIGHIFLNSITPETSVSFSENGFNAGNNRFIISKAFNANDYYYPLTLNLGGDAGYITGPNNFYTSSISEGEVSFYSPSLYILAASNQATITGSVSLTGSDLTYDQTNSTFSSTIAMTATASAYEGLVTTTLTSTSTQNVTITISELKELIGKGTIASALSLSDTEEDFYAISGFTDTNDEASPYIKVKFNVPDYSATNNTTSNMIVGSSANVNIKGFGAGYINVLQGTNSGTVWSPTITGASVNTVSASSVGTGANTSFVFNVTASATETVSATIMSGYYLNSSWSYIDKNGSEVSATIDNLQHSSTYTTAITASLPMASISITFESTTNTGTTAYITTGALGQNPTTANPFVNGNPDNSKQYIAIQTSISVNPNNYSLAVTSGYFASNLTYNYTGEDEQDHTSDDYAKSRIVFSNTNNLTANDTKYIEVFNPCRIVDNQPTPYAVEPTNGTSSGTVYTDDQGDSYPTIYFSGTTNSYYRTSEPAQDEDPIFTADVFSGIPLNCLNKKYIHAVIAANMSPDAMGQNVAASLNKLARRLNGLATN